MELLAVTFATKYCETVTVLTSPLLGIKDTIAPSSLWLVLLLPRGDLFKVNPPHLADHVNCGLAHGDGETTAIPAARQVLGAPSCKLGPLAWSEKVNMELSTHLADCQSRAANGRLFRMMVLDFTAILLGYNLPRDNARLVASRIAEQVRGHFASTGAILDAGAMLRHHP